MTPATTPIRLLALDVDGTLLDPDHQLRPATVAAVRACLDAGVAVALATGRLSQAIRPICTALGLGGPQVVVNGALVVDIDSGEVLASSLLGDAQLDIVEPYVRALGVPYCVFGLEEIYALPGMPGLELLQEFGEPVPRRVPALRSAYVPAMTKLLTISPDASHDAMLRRELSGVVSVVRTHRLFFEFLAPEASKGHGVTLLAERLGLRLEQVAAIGDSFNDLSMFAIAGLSIAMGQAPAEVRERAHFVTGDNAHDGCAEAIRRYVL
jgi:Cof subfamily protein (haloacid dehalogenase superfamily)